MRRKRSGLLSNIIFYVISVALAVMVVIPFYWMIITSLKSKGALMALPIQWIPRHPTLQSYRKVFSLFPFGKAILNSLFVSITFTVITVLSSSMAAFAIAKIRFKGAGVFFRMYLMSMMIPTQITLIPLFIIMSRLNLTFSAFSIFLLVQNLRSLPDDFMEAARIDGASLWTTFFRVIMPMEKPVLATLVITTFMGAWNDYLWPLVMLSDKNKMTLTLALNTLNGQYGTEYNVLMAGCLISMIPIIVVYIIAQTQMKQGITAGGVKG